jgi:hypothetical protein
MIPYVIAEAHPCYKRPSVDHYYGAINEEEMKKYFLDQISTFILERTLYNELSLQDINNFFDNYYEDSFMMNKPWTAMIFRNGKWENVTPTNLKICENIKLMKLREQEVKKKEDKQENNEIDDERILLDNMREFFDKMLKEKPLPSWQIKSLQKMNEDERLLSLSSIYMTTENYNNNKEIFRGVFKFFN